MKYPIKRLLAGLLAALMLPVWTLPAFSTDQRTPGSTTTKGSLSNEGTVPTDVIQVVMPTERADMFNFIIDPNNLIRRSNAVKYGGVEFGPGNLFFKNVDDGEVSYSMNSDDLKIINKSTCPLNLELSISASKGSSQFEFAKTTDFKNSQGIKIKGRAIYLALVNDRRSAPVTTITANSSTTHTAKLKGWIEDPHAYDIAWSNAQNRYIYALKDGIEDDDLPYTSYHMTGAINSANWDGVGDITFTVTWSLSKEKGPDENPIPDEDTDPTILVTEAALQINDKATLSFDWGWGEKEMSRITKMVYTNASGRESSVPAVSISNATTDDLVLVNDADKVVTIAANTTIYRGSDWKLEFESLDGQKNIQIAFDLKRSSVDAVPKVTLKSRNPALKIGDTPEYTFDYGNADKAMSEITGLIYTTAAGIQKSLALSSEYVTFDMENKTFTITAFKKIFEGSGWKLEYTDAEGGYYAAPFTLREASVRITDTKPTVKVDTPVSHWNTDAALSFTLGSGKYAMDRVDHLEYTDRNGNLITINANSGGFTVDEDTAKATINMTIPIYAGSKWKLCFVNNDDVTPIFESVDLALLANPHDDPPQDSPPSASVTQTAGDIGEEVVIAYDLGYGPEGKAKVARLDYTSKAGGSVSVTTGSGLSIGESTVTFTATDGIYKSKKADWRLVFTDADGSNPYSVPVDIKSSDAVEYPDQSPKIVSIKQAMDLNDPVEIIVDFGKGEDARPIISHFEYTGENGNVALKDGGGITVSGDKVTLAATREIYVGKNWKLGFLDSEGKNPYLLDVPLLGEGHETDIDKDPTAEVPESVQVESDGELVTKYNKARHIGDIVTVNVNYGKGLKERTKIAYLEYTVKGNEDKPDQVKQLVPDGSKLLVSATTVNVKMVKALYAAEDWKLVFANEKGGSLYPIEVALKDLENADPVPEGPSGPNITVEEAASAVGNPVKVTFERANMDKVSGVYYRNSTGTAAFLAVGTKNVTLVDDNTLSINAVSALFNGSNWAVRFSSEDGTETQDISFDMMTAAGPLYDSDPTAIVKTAAKAQGNQAVIALTYGTGDAEKTKVIGLAYKNASGAEAMLAVGTKNVSQDGDTLTINAISNVFKGSKWRIRFADENDTSNYKDVAFDLKNTG